MFKNYLKVALRIFRREKGFTFINILGLVMGISCSLFIYLWLQDELKYNRFFEGNERVCNVLSNAKMSNGDIETYHSMPYNLKKVLEDHYPSVKQVAVLSWGNWMAFRKGNILMEQAGIDASPEIVDLLQINFIKGDHKVMYTKPQTIAISESFANSIYGDRWKSTNVIGESIVNEAGESYELSGIYSDLPKQSTLQFEFIIPFELRVSKNPWLKNWDNSGSQLFIQLEDNVPFEEAQQNIRQVLVKYSDAENDGNLNQEIFLQPFRDVYLYNRIENGKIAGGRIEYVKLLGIAAILILVLAGINFTNLSTARSAKRAKEIGVRKVLGSYGSNLRIQFLTESITITTLSLIISLAVVYALLPQFNTLTGKSIGLDFLSAEFALYLISFVFTLGILSGIYPAFYITSIKTIASLKGMYKHERNDVLFRKGLVVFQFMITVIMITSSITVFRQVGYIESKNIGLDRSRIIRSWAHAIDSKKDYDVFKNEVLKRPGIESVTLVNQNLIDLGNSSNHVTWNGKQQGEESEFYILNANPDLLPTTGIKLKEGRNFSWSNRTDTANYIINEAAQKLMRLEHAVGEDLEMWDVKGKIIGVISDFHNASLHAPIEPMIIRYDQTQNWMILARTAPGKTKEAVASLGEVYHMFNPKREFVYQFMDDVYNEYYKSEFMVKDISLYFTILCIIVSCLGLFALVAYSAEQRTREIGIRKVLGASVINVLHLLSGEFLLLLSISLVAAIPLSYYILNDWLNGFTYRTELSWWLFSLAGSITLFISYFIIGGQAIKSALANPVDSLKAD